MSVEALTWAFRQDVTPASAKLVLVALANRADEDGLCYPSYNTISKQCSMHRATVIRHVDALLEAGLIEKIAQTRDNGSDRSNLYRLTIGGVGSQSATRGVANYNPRGVANCDPLYTNIDNTNTDNKNKKNALAREDFLREINKAFQDGAEFQEFAHLTEREIMLAAAACHDFHAVKGEWPAGLPVPIMRHWLRNGIARGKIRKAQAAKPPDDTARPPALAQPDLSPSVMAAWKAARAQIKQKLGEAAFRSWIEPVILAGFPRDGEAELCAPTRFMADWIMKKYGQVIVIAMTAAFKRRMAIGIEVIQPQPQKKEIA